MSRAALTGEVVSVASDGAHRFSKEVRAKVRLLAGLDVEGDAHCGRLVQHRSRVAVDPIQPNLRQVHLIASELLETLAARGFDIAPGQMGENVTTRGVDLSALPRGALLHLEAEAVVELTGLRNPCAQIEAFRPGLLAEVLGRDASCAVIRRAGVMGVVLAGGEVRAGDALRVTLPEGPHQALERV